MKLRRVNSKKRQQSGFQIRYTCPVTGSRKKRTFWTSDIREAERRCRRFMNDIEDQADGGPGADAHKTPFLELCKRFLEQAPISTEDRRNALRSCLEYNPLNLQTAGELMNTGDIYARCEALLARGADALPKRDDGMKVRRTSDMRTWIRRQVQKPLKQLMAWAVTVRALRYNPGLKLLPQVEVIEGRGFFWPDEIRAIFEAADEIDRVEYRKHPSTLIFKTLLFSGNRPGAIFGAKVKNLKGSRIELPKGKGKKFNGVCTLPKQFVADLQRFILSRGAVNKLDEHLLLSPDGKAVSGRNIQRHFERAATLAFVRRLMPAGVTVSALKVADTIFKGRVPGFDGPPPTDPEKLTRRMDEIKQIKRLAEKLRPTVADLLRNRPMYTLRHTHLTWAALAGVSEAIRDVQTGHKPRTLEGQHYVNQELLDASECSRVVWEVFTDARKIKKPEHMEAEEPALLALAAGAELAPIVAPNEKTGHATTKAQKRQVITQPEVLIGAGDGVRSRDLRLGKLSETPVFIGAYSKFHRKKPAKITLRTEFYSTDFPHFTSAGCSVARGNRSSCSGL